MLWARELALRLSMHRIVRYFRRPRAGFNARQGVGLFLLRPKDTAERQLGTLVWLSDKACGIMADGAAAAVAAVRGGCGGGRASAVSLGREGGPEQRVYRFLKRWRRRLSCSRPPPSR